MCRCLQVSDICLHAGQSLKTRAPTKPLKAYISSQGLDLIQGKAKQNKTQTQTNKQKKPSQNFLHNFSKSKNPNISWNKIPYKCFIWMFFFGKPKRTVCIKSLCFWLLHKWMEYIWNENVNRANICFCKTFQFVTWVLQQKVFHQGDIKVGIRKRDFL